MRSAPTTDREATWALVRGHGMGTVLGNPGSLELVLSRAGRPMLSACGAIRNAAFVNRHSAGGVGRAMGALFATFKSCAPQVITVG